MKILIIIQRWYGGQGVVGKNLKEEIEKIGHKVKIISREEDLKAFGFLKGIKQIRKAIKKEDYDILYTQDWSITLSSLGFKKHFACFHGQEYSKASKILQKITGKIMGKRLVVVGDKLKQLFPKSNLIYNGINPERFFDKGKERKYFGWIKRDYDVKTEQEVKKIAEEHGLPLLIAEKIPYEKMNDFYNKLKVFASYPPEYTGFNMCWLEAQASGVPKILGNKNGIGINNLNKYKDWTWKKHAKKLLNLFNQTN